MSNHHIENVRFRTRLKPESLFIVKDEMRLTESARYRSDNQTILWVAAMDSAEPGYLLRLL